MAKKKDIQAWGLDEGVLLRVDKAPGEEQAKIQTSFTSGVAAARGISLMVICAAEQMGVPPEHLLCVVTTILMADAVKPERVEESPSEWPDSQTRGIE